MENDEMTNDAAVAWEERHRGPDGEWRAWTPCSKAYFDGYATSNNYENRALVPATTVAELRAEVERLTEQLRYVADACEHETARADAAERRVAAAIQLAAEWRREATLCDNDANRQPFDSFASMLEYALTKESP